MEQEVKQIMDKAFNDPTVKSASVVSQQGFVLYQSKGENEKLAPFYKNLADRANELQFINQENGQNGNNEQSNIFEQNPIIEIETETEKIVVKNYDTFVIGLTKTNNK